MRSRSVLTIALFLAAGLAFGADPTPQPTPAPYSLEALTGQLSMLQFGARNNPALALTHDQAQKLLPILKKWQANPTLGPTESKDLFGQAQAVLTSDQKAFKPAPRGNRPAGQGSGAAPGPGAASGQRQGGFSAGSGGNRQGGAGGQSLSYQDRMAQALDRLIQRLEKL